ncbi:hypothetical protein O181_022942 [Austropuccinia psidii MF-1]|uniref:Uncharacterized protein n=1 Tax=Austropuccinia psidii MF-1 TaxID=1389203 RepID=A0A9Q3CIK4_9BASI|nr:hypothetical protein [Austropuccinia psidii MF-1]
MRPKGVKGEFHHSQGPGGSQTTSGPTSANFGPNLNNPKMAKWTPGPKLGKNHIFATFKPWPLATTTGHQLRSRKASPQLKGRPLLHQCTLYQRIQVWCRYGIIYHYAPFLLRNPMVIFSRPNYFFSIPVPNSITHFEGTFFQSFSLAIPGGYQKTI